MSWLYLRLTLYILLHYVVTQINLYINYMNMNIKMNSHIFVESSYKVTIKTSIDRV
jgi:hypothetical protein